MKDQLYNLAATMLTDIFGKGQIPFILLADVGDDNETRIAIGSNMEAEGVRAMLADVANNPLKEETGDAAAPTISGNKEQSNV